MTLIELLAVIVIITTIVAAAIPLISPTNDDRRLREAARGLNTYIVGAQARAIALHRPVGVALKRMPQDRGMCVEAYYVEQQPAYAGLDVNSRACVAIHPTIPGFVLVRFVTRGAVTTGLPIGWTVDLFPDDMIHPGDVVEVNGTRFVLLPPPFNPYNGDMTIDANTGCFRHSNRSRVAILAAQPLNDSGQQINPKYDNLGREIGSVAQAQPPYWTSPAPYQILRQPVAMSDEPYQLPEGTAIDLRASGVGNNNFFYVQDDVDNDEGILILFAPEGRVARVGYYLTPNASPNDPPAFDQAVVDNVYLLVGRRDRVPPDASTDPTLQSASWTAADTDDKRAKLREPINWLGTTSRWIVIGSQSGRIATIENALFSPTPTILSLGSNEAHRNQQILATRELTKEMGQLGGR